MPLGFRQRRKVLINANYLDLTPYQIYKVETDEQGFVTVLVPKFTNKILVRFLASRLKFPHFKINLDEIGSESWKQIDGKREVREIIANLDKLFGERVQPVSERVTKFLTRLYMEGYISFNEIKKEGE
ncbi:MAG: PqqD family protein [Ignavibacteria bacterium]